MFTKQEYLLKHSHSKFDYNHIQILPAYQLGHILCICTVCFGTGIIDLRDTKNITDKTDNKEVI